MANNIDIFICTHKDFKKCVNSDKYTVIDSREIRDKVDLPLLDDFYSEFYQFKYIVDNIKLKKYVGICHYRRYFDFFDNVPDMNEIFKEYDCIVARPMTLNMTVRSQYDVCHNVEDIDLAGKIIKSIHPSYYKAYENVVNGKIFVPNNMVIMKRADFKKYVKFVFSIIDKYLEIVGTDIYKRINENKSKYIKANSTSNSVEYQYRIGGFLMERMTNVFLMKNFKKMKIYDVIKTEKKYDHEKN